MKEFSGTIFKLLILSTDLFMDPRDVVELGLKNRECILRKFDNERSVRELIKIFESVLHR